jgi:uncharacterized Zn finger protein (UPF0148 family)
MPKEVFEFSCPCCGKRVELNTRNGKVRAVKIEESKKGKSFDDLLSDQARESDRLGSVFDEARQDQAKQGEKLDDLLREAKKAAKDDQDKKPPHPFQQD